MNRLPKILFVKRDDGGCGYFRCVQPATFLKRAGLADTETVSKFATTEQLLSADLVVLQEMGDINGSNIANFCIKNKIPYIAEIDDFLHHISPHNTAGYGCWNPTTLYLSRAIQLIQKASAVTVSTNQLAREYFPYNNIIYVVPNYLDKDKWDNPIVKNTTDKIKIGWCGGNAHADDLKMISLVINKIVKEYKGKIIFETMGMTSQELAGVFPMKIFNDVCPSCGYEGELRHFYGEDLDHYPVVLASKGWDIAVAPVINNAFGNCKSDLKIKEYAAAGISIVASSIIPYKEAVENNAQIRLVDENFEKWYNEIKDLIDNPKERDGAVRNNREWVSRYWIQDNIYKIAEIYQQTISRADLILGKRKK